MQRGRLLIIGAFLAASVSGGVPQGAATSATEAQDVTIVQLLATPERFHGKRVSVVGWWTWAREESVLYLDSEAAAYRSNRVWLDLNFAQARDFAPAQNGYCIIEGEFDAEKGNAYARIPTSIRKITRITRRRSRAELGVEPPPRPAPTPSDVP